MTFLGRIAANGRHLLSLINQILDLSKVEAGRTKIENQLVPLDVLIHETVKQLEGQVQSSKLKLLTDIPLGTKPFTTDPDRLKQVLINLIGNAIKFTEKGHVIVRLGADPSSRRPIWIEVEDTGIGIPEDRQGVIFEAFHQADDSTSRKYGGSGLGLAISASLLRLLGCNIVLESAPGHGSTFRIVLPQAEALLLPESADEDSAVPALQLDL